MTRGIYTITNLKTGKVYVGQSSDIHSRWNLHKYELSKRTHGNYKLLREWVKYGPDAFEFKVAEEVFDDSIDEREGYWIDQYQGFVYNIIRGDHPTRKKPVVVDGIQDFDSYGAAASWYGVSVWCVRTGARKNQEVDCGHSKHIFRKQNDNFSTLWSFKDFEVYSFGETEEPLYEPEVDYIKEELVKKCWEAAQECLTEEDYGLFHAHFELGLDGKSLGDMTGVSKQAMSKKFKAINQKVQKHVLNKKWEL